MLSPLVAALPLLAPMAPPTTPPLVVVLVVDQLRLEDVERLQPLLSRGGLAGLEERGVLLDGRYLTVNTETGPGHATLSTGAYANEHGVTANTLMTDHGRRYVVQDDDVRTWGLSDPKHGRSPEVLLVPTVSDQLKLSSGGRSRVVSVTGKDRSSVLTAGFSGDAAIWWDADQARFVSSTWYAEKEPAWLSQFNKAHAASSLASYTWEPHKPLASFTSHTRADNAPGEGERYGMPTTFPKALARIDAAKLGHAVRVTPRMDALVLEAALQTAQQYALCKDSEPDLLWVGLSGFDMIGHAYGPHSAERADAFHRLSGELASFLGKIQKQCGKQEIAVILTADHGVTPLPEDSSALRIPSGRLPWTSVIKAADDALDASVGKQDWVALFSPPHLWLSQPSGRTPTCDELDATARAVAKLPGVGRAVANCRLQYLANPLWLPFHHVAHPVRSGDILVELAPMWLWNDGSGDVGGADHGTSSVTDQRVPVLISAPGFRVPQPYQDAPVDMRQVAPTIATLLNVTPPAAARSAPLVVRERAARR